MHVYIGTTFACLLFIFGYLNAFDSKDVCMKDDTSGCSTPTGPRYLFYDVNQPEGFNLRRDVYMRIAIFVHKFKEKNWILVLPPWPHLYHWQSKLVQQDQLPWSHFFDVASLKKFASVKEMHEIFKETEGDSLKIKSIYVLQHYKDAFSTKNWNWNDKWSFDSCISRPNYEKSGEVYKGLFWGYNNITAKSVRCVSFQGGAGLLDDLLEQTNERDLMLDHAEVILHDNFGDKQYWQCRRSMKFAQPLIDEANHFRKQVLNVSDISENLHKGRKENRTVKGGDYLCVHLRRRDFVAGRPEEIPSIQSAAKQISEALRKLNLTTVFIASDASAEERMELKQLLHGFILVNYSPDIHSLMKYKDGGIAIIDQIICSYARYFIGSYESTFSFRIQEEREILGFPAETTFNRLCGTNTECIQPSKWRIQL